MNTPDYNYEPSRQMSAFLPILLLGISMAFLFVYQISLLVPQRATFQQAIQQGNPNVQQSQQIQTAFQRLVMDVVTLAQTDKDAQAVVAKYGIQVTGMATPAPSASPSATPAPGK